MEKEKQKARYEELRKLREAHNEKIEELIFTAQREDVIIQNNDSNLNKIVELRDKLSAEIVKANRLINELSREHSTAIKANNLFEFEDEYQELHKAHAFKWDNSLYPQPRRR